MSEWRKVRLGDIAEFSNGVNFDKTAYAPGVKLIGVSDFGNRYYPNYDELKEVQSEVVKDNNYLRDGDIVFVRSNGNKELVGRCMLICNPPMPVTYSGFCIRCRFYNPAEYLPSFFAYLFKTASFRQSMSGNAVGANIQNLSQGRLNSYVADIPDYPTQERIAGILSAYDNLIENNQKQIRLLEEAARRLYKEWFVDFRFPGYESVPITDGVPQGWRKIPVGELIGYEIGGGWGEETPTKDCDKEGFVIRGTDLYGLTHGVIQSVSFRYHAAHNLSARTLVDGDIIFEVSGGSKTEGVARTAFINDALLKRWDSPVMCASFCKLIRVSDKRYAQFLYDCLQYLRKCGKTSEYDKKSASSIVNYRWKDFLSQERVLIPDETTLLCYNQFASAIYQKIVNCSMQIELCAKASDRLLPKLMSGELESIS